ncbi:phosphatidylinositol transfer protein 3-like [Schistocerca gregaria]|uniref:phosphatidylinositol transfer protein 3-like n=1 Tax=Schistocerca gregaria TaxID=7010 RepID=UPI00211E78B2|nr:phosphatidylinositol transfer protein 3-like [Schistocerca gregaria]
MDSDSSISNSGCNSPSSIEESAQRLKKKVIELYQGPWNQLNARLVGPQNLRRYLRARSYDIDKAAVMLHESLVWREDVRPESISAREIEVHLKRGANFFLGYDKRKRPIMISKVHLDIDEHLELKTKVVLYQIERCIRMMRKTKVSNLTWLVDLKHFPAHLMSPSHTQLAISIVKLLSSHYPERLGTMIAINAPAIFNVFWKVISRFVDRNTAQKIIILKSKDISRLRSFIDDEVIETEYGGLNDYVYDHEENMKTLLEEEKVWMKKVTRYRNEAVSVDQLLETRNPVKMRHKKKQ